MSTFQSIVSFLDEDVFKFIDYLFKIWSDLERFINSLNIFVKKFLIIKNFVKLLCFVR